MTFAAGATLVGWCDIESRLVSRGGAAGAPRGLSQQADGLIVMRGWVQRPGQLNRCGEIAKASQAGEDLIVFENVESLAFHSG
jgi:hypothetical protein